VSGDSELPPHNPAPTTTNDPQETADPTASNVATSSEDEEKEKASKPKRANTRAP
ncbi:hypothetical protein MKX01_039455, partial [Papaver californicum]